ncbi:MAG: hypothetical protein K8R85_15250 [Bacteroidetes bacterium]|nr:hypothetical protein [Bacteroidota bacterium]
MIAYDPSFLRNSSIVKKSKQWYSKQLISAEQMNSILKNYTTGFYSPNLFIKIGLFIFTFFAIAASVGFYSLFFLILNVNPQTGFLVFTCLLFSVGCVFLLEYFIKNKKVYRAGVDECLLYSALGFILIAIGMLINDGFEPSENALLFCILAVPFLIAAIVRYADRFVTLIAAVCLYAIFFLSLLKLGEIAKLIMPFSLMIVSIPVYFFAIQQKQKETLFYWKKCIEIFELLALIVFYLAGNYFVIREASIAFFDMQLNDGENIPLAFIFYIFTAIIPLLYVYYGLKKKDKTLLWTGLLLIAAAVLTFKYYFSLGHPEITLTIAGMILIMVSYVCIKMLKTPKYGITFEEEPDEDNFLRSNAEALVIAQNFGAQSAETPSDTQFGGGGFGGAGSGGNF